MALPAETIPALVLETEDPAVELGRRIFFVPSCSSTQDVMVSQCERFGHGDVLWTARQRAGRGRYGRRWFSPAGSLAFSLRLQSDDAEPARLPLVVALAITRYCQAAGIAAEIKWPNDVYVSGRKLAGILTESQSCGVPWELIIGIGINVSLGDDDLPAELRPQVTSLAQEGLNSDCRTVLTGIVPLLDAVWAEYRAGGFAALLPAIREHLLWLGERVVVRNGDRQVRGTVAGIAEAGHLLVDGETIVAGEMEKWNSPA